MVFDYKITIVNSLPAPISSNVFCVPKICIYCIFGKKSDAKIVQSMLILMVTLKCAKIIVQTILQFFQYCDSNFSNIAIAILFFFIAPCEVITLIFLCLSFWY